MCGEKKVKKNYSTLRFFAKYFLSLKELCNEMLRFSISCCTKILTLWTAVIFRNILAFSMKLEPINLFGFFYALSKLCLLLLSVDELPRVELNDLKTNCHKPAFLLYLHRFIYVIYPSSYAILI